MKKLLLLASLLLVAAGANAKTQTKDLGHVSVSGDTAWPYDGYVAAQDETDMGFGVKLPASMVSNYAGCKIVGFRVGWGNPDLNGELNMFLRENSFNAPDVVSQKATVYNNSQTWYNWNEVKLETPYVIPQNPGDLYMGYYVSFPARQVTASMSSLGLKPANSCYFSFNDELDENGERIWFDVLAEYNALLLVAIVEVPDNLDLSVAAQITELFTPGIQRIGTLKTAYAKIKNQGAEDITSIKIRYSIGDNSYEHVQNLSAAIAASEQKAVYIPSAALASGDTNIEISEINGKPNTHKQELSYPMLAVPTDVAGKYHHRPVVEFFGSETVHQQPYYFDSIFMVGFKPHLKEISLISHHVLDQFMTGDDEDSALAMMLSDNNPNISYPSAMFDRSQITTSAVPPSAVSVIGNLLFPWAAEAPYAEILERPTFLSVNVDNALNAAKDELKITVSGYIEPNVLPKDEKMYISVYVLEDDVKSTAQDWTNDEEKERYGGVMSHKAVIRQRPTFIYGDALVESGEYSASYTVDLDPEEWKLNDMRVVALLHRGPRNHRFSRQVLNCGEAYVDPEHGSIFAVAADGTEATIRVANGQITVNGSTEGVTVYTLAGAAIPNSNIPQGVYVVSSNSIKTKVIVK